jgi:L,D-transpeptidase catalytic domain
MSRGHHVLLAALVGVLAVVGVGWLISSPDDGPRLESVAAAAPSTSAAPPSTVAPSTTAVPSTTSTVAEPVFDDQCPDGRSAVVDRANQRGWLCEGGELTYEFPLTSARSQPDPGTYEVYAKDLNASSNISGSYSTMTHFVAFTKGKYQGARIAFHSVPKDGNGDWVQPLDSVGTPELFGASAGCIRVLPDDAVTIWDWLDQGASVRVIS